MRLERLLCNKVSHRLCKLRIVLLFRDNDHITMRVEEY